MKKYTVCGIVCLLLFAVMLSAGCTSTSPEELPTSTPAIVPTETPESTQVITQTPIITPTQTPAVDPVEYQRMIHRDNDDWYRLLKNYAEMKKLRDDGYYNEEKTLYVQVSTNPDKYVEQKVIEKVVLTVLEKNELETQINNALSEMEKLYFLDGRGNWHDPNKFDAEKYKIAFDAEYDKIKPR